MSTVSYTGSAMASALKGMQASGGAMRDAAGVVLKDTIKQLNGPTSETDTVTMSDAAGGLERGLLDMNQASYAHLANTKVVAAADEQFQATLDLLHPVRE